MSTTYYSQLRQTGLGEVFHREEFEQMESVEKKFPFASNDYYLSLMDSTNPQDPIRRIIMPDPRELMHEGSLDPSAEESYTVLPGLQHKYPQTALVLINSRCAGICRFCFRKRLFGDAAPPPVCNICQVVDYLQNKPEVSNVLLSGGDPLLMNPSDLDHVFTKLRELSHIPIIRVGTKVPAYDPARIVNNPDLVEVLQKHSYDDRKTYVVSHFNHPVEITDTARDAISCMKHAGVEMISQTPMIRGVNDDPRVLSTLLQKLSFLGVSPYYVFQCRPTAGNRHLTVPIERGLEIFGQAQALCSGLAKRARFIMSHKTGKIEIIGKTQKHIYMRYHQAASPEDLNTMLVYRPNPQARWFDDYQHRLSDMVPKMTWLF